ncbi:MAG: hypothetical protein AAB414_01710 [Patescibacteria group bacterium]
MDEIIGWIGVGLVVSAYFLLATKKLSSSSRIYHLMNLLGAIGVGFNAFAKGANPNIGSNAIWALIALYGLYKAFRGSKRVDF